MRIAYKTLRIFAAALLCLFLQQCAHDIPVPAQAPKPTTAATQFAEAIAIGEVHTKQEKVVKSQQAESIVLDNDGSSPSLLAQQSCAKYYMVYYDNTGAEVGRDFMYSDCADGGGGGGGGSGDGGGWGGGSTGGSGGSAGSGGNWNGFSPSTTLVVLGEKPVSDIRQFLKCFTTTQGATFTVYVRQPVPGTSDTWSVKGGVGHTFI